MIVKRSFAFFYLKIFKYFFDMNSSIFFLIKELDGDFQISSSSSHIQNIILEKTS